LYCHSQATTKAKRKNKKEKEILETETKRTKTSREEKIERNEIVLKKIKNNKKRINRYINK
jgi:hypothetical protein